MQSDDRSIVYLAGAFCKPRARVWSDDFQSVALIRCRFSPAFQALIKRSVLRTYSTISGLFERSHIDPLSAMAAIIHRLGQVVEAHPASMPYRIQGNK